MSEANEINYGPLSELIGTWKGNTGVDIAPEPNGKEKNPYFETITFTPKGDVTNAKSQTLVVVSYHQVVQHHSNGEVFHDQTGYWMWDEKAGVIIHSLNIPRAVCVLAGGQHHGQKTEGVNVVLEVSASLDSPDWQIIQSPFMRDNAKTTAFSYRAEVGNGKLSYAQTTTLDIYGKAFEHTDQNELTRV